MSQMEPDVQELLKKILWTIGSCMLWMLINTLVGIKWNWAFFEGRVGLGNILFYIWLVGSLILLLWFYYRLWKKDIFQ